MPEGGVRTNTLGLVFSAAVFCGLEDVSPEPEMIYQHQIYSTDEKVNTRNLTIVYSNVRICNHFTWHLDLIFEQSQSY